MAIDKSEPRSGRIAVVGAVAIVTLLGTRQGLIAYFDRVTSDEAHRKIAAATPEQLLGQRADEKQRLSSGPMPIDKSMQELSKKGRMGASPELMPQPSKDLAPLQGWMQMPGDVPEAMTAPPPTPPPPPPEAADGGAAAHADGAAPAAPSGSAAPPPPRPHP